MITYSIVITAALAFTLGFITHNIIEVWYDHLAPKKAKHSPRNQFGADTDADMDEAVALVEDKLGGTILSYEKS